MKAIVQLLLILLWLAGIVIAKGFWSTFFSIIFLPYSWYLVIEKIILYYGIA